MRLLMEVSFYLHFMFLRMAWIGAKAVTRTASATKSEAMGGGDARGKRPPEAEIRY